MTVQPWMKQLDQSMTAIERKIKTVGAWCHKKGLKGPEHYYISRNPKSSMCVSVCKQVTVPITSLSETDPEVKCMVCHLFLTSEKEVYRNQVDRVTEELPDDPN